MTFEEWVINRYITGDGPDNPEYPVAFYIQIKCFPVILRRLFILTIPISSLIWCILFVVLFLGEIIFGILCILIIGIFYQSPRDFKEWYNEHWD